MASRLTYLISKKTNCTCSTLFLLISKKQICTCSTLFCLSLAVVLHDYNSVLYDWNVKLSSHTLFLWRNCRLCRVCLPNILFPVSMFAFIFHLPLIFTCWPLAFLISSPPLWISMFFFLWNSSPLFSITRSSSFSVISYPRLCKHKKWRRKRHDFAVVFSFEKSGRSCDFLPNKTLSCIWVAVTVDWVILHWYGYGAGGRSVYGHVITKCSWVGRLPHFLSYGAPPTLRY